MFANYIDESKSIVNSSSSRRGNGRNKLRTYTILSRIMLLKFTANCWFLFVKEVPLQNLDVGWLLLGWKLEGMNICRWKRDVVLIILILLKMNIMLFCIVLFIMILDKFFWQNLLKLMSILIVLQIVRKWYFYFRIKRL